MKRISILLLDEHKLLRETIGFILERDGRFLVTGITGDVAEALRYCHERKPSIAIVGTHMTPVDGFQATESILTSYPAVKVIGISVYSIPILVKRLFKLGATGYLTKNASYQDLITCILTVEKGDIYISEEVKNALVAEEVTGHENNEGLSSLTKRELDIVEAVRNGKSSRDIAGELGLAPKTIEAHRYHILKKLKLKNSAALVQFASQQGI